jgi:transposase
LAFWQAAPSPWTAAGSRPSTRDKNFTPGAMRRRMEQVEASIARYLSLLDTADRQEDEVAQMRTVRLRDRLDRLRQQMRDLHTMESAVAVAPDAQVSLTDPDARAMATNGKGTGLVGYNVQAAVDAKHHLIVAHEVTNIGHDPQPARQHGAPGEGRGGNRCVLADRGYFSGEEVLACDEIGISAIVPKPLKSGAAAERRWGKQDFTYESMSNTCRCPAGETLKRRFSSVEKDMTLHTYWADGCGARLPMGVHCELAPDDVYAIPELLKLGNVLCLQPDSFQVQWTPSLNYFPEISR